VDGRVLAAREARSATDCRSDGRALAVGVPCVWSSASLKRTPSSRIEATRANELFRRHA